MLRARAEFAKFANIAKTASSSETAAAACNAARVPSKSNERGAQ